MINLIKCKKENVLLTISSRVVYLLAGLKERFWGVSGYKLYSYKVQFENFDAIGSGKLDQFSINLTDVLLFENLCAWKCLHLAAPCLAPPVQPESALWSRMYPEEKKGYELKSCDRAPLNTIKYKNNHEDFLSVSAYVSPVFC